MPEVKPNRCTEYESGYAWVEAMRAARVPTGEAIRIAVGGSIPAWAARHDIARQPATMTINGQLPRPHARVVAALASDLGCAEDEVRALLLASVAEWATAEQRSAVAS